MPRVEFTSMPEFKKWLKVMSERGRKYIAYITEKEELIIQPLSSTAPVTYAYCAKVGDSAKVAVLEREIEIVKIKRFEWTSENQIKKD